MLTWPDIQQQPLPPPGQRIAYGDDPQQFGELRLPTDEGPFPVVVLLHGGCWLAEYDYRHITPLAAALTRQGYATWTLEYRRVGNAGGGWPNTFIDAGMGLDALRNIAVSRPIDLSAIILIGHSAGGQLALWLPTRKNLPTTSLLYTESPLAVKAVIGLAAIGDMARHRQEPGGCQDAVDQVLGGSPEQVPERYAQTSPIQRLPIGVPVWMLSGQKDPIVSPASVESFVDAARQHGDSIDHEVLPDTGHYEWVAHESHAFNVTSIVTSRLHVAVNR